MKTVLHSILLVALAHAHLGGEAGVTSGTVRCRRRPSSVPPVRIVYRLSGRFLRRSLSPCLLWKTLAGRRAWARPSAFRRLQRLLACSGYRQIAREACCAASTVMGQAARLGRHALLALHRGRPPGGPAEPLVIDGFESFAYSQYHPLHLNLAIGAESHYLYAFTHTELRRKGKMRPAQRRRRAWLEQRFGRPDPGALTRDIADLVRQAAPAGGDLVIRSDEHPAYPRALARLAGYRIRHECTPSVQARTPGNPLFAVNLADLLLRHNSANHKRETIAFSKRHQSVIERAAILFLWRNFTKPFSENHGGGTPPFRPPKPRSLNHETSPHFRRRGVRGDRDLP